MMGARWTGVAAVCLSGLAVAGGPTAADLREHCREVVDEGFAGVVLVERDGEVLFRGAFGVNADEVAEPVSEDTLFYVGSVAKVFTTTATLRLAGEGVVSLDEPIGAYLQGVPEDKQRVTLRHLLTHTAGLPTNHPNPMAALDRAAFVAWCLGLDLESEPGASWAYSNVGFSLVAAILEQAAGRPFQVIMHDTVFEPAGMDGARFVDELDDAALPVAIGTGELSERYGVPGDPRGFVGSWLRFGAGGIVMTADDLLAFDRALRVGRLLDEDQIDQTTSPVREGWGMGWRLSRTRFGEPLLFHDGRFPGFNAGYARVPNDNACLIVLSNLEDGMGMVQGPAMDLLMGDD